MPTWLKVWTVSFCLVNPFANANYVIRLTALSSVDGPSDMAETLAAGEVFVAKGRG
jgi:hypothetical protein